MRETQGRQVPWEHSALTARFYFTPPQQAGPSPQQSAEIAFWNSVKDSRDPAVITIYLDRFPHGMFAALARVLIDNLQREAEHKAALAVREAEFGAAQATERAAEARQAEAARKANAAKQAEELREAQQQLRKAQEDARLAREAAKAADQQRLAAVKAAEEAVKASEKARRELTRDATQKTSSEPRVPKLTTKSGPLGGHDGVGGESLKYWPNYTVPTGQSVTTTTVDGRKLTCIGGDRHGTPRRCRWN